jgi:hypothetical protein
LKNGTRPTDLAMMSAQQRDARGGNSAQGGTNMLAPFGSSSIDCDSEIVVAPMLDMLTRKRSTSGYVWHVLTWIAASQYFTQDTAYSNTQDMSAHTSISMNHSTFVGE